VASKLLESSSIEKIMEIDSHIGCAMSGLTADARTMIDHARVTSQNHAFVYDEPVGVESCAQAVCDLALRFGESVEDDEALMVSLLSWMVVGLEVDQEGRAIADAGILPCSSFSLDLSELPCSSLESTSVDLSCASSPLLAPSIDRLLIRHHSRALQVSYRPVRNLYEARGQGDRFGFGSRSG
jgi:hypothetical protein